MISNKTQENIKEIPGFPRYLIDTSGNVYTKRTNKLLKGNISSNGYLRYKLQSDDGAKLRFAHRLVLNTFDPNPYEDKYYISHKDKNKLNNNIDNLVRLQNKKVSTKSKRRGDKITRVENGMLVTRIVGD